ncbi:hypothetical protein RhiirA4_530939 [Rhizophagus irregularis]|uniref:HMG box domain-containing protein n=1 Tax=Rhizophagus irregularis TaxID=588596 RepID=A0A2I1G0M2_9GLOM|nr:hypothetical protein RhiirA4_530939 [Rhizophagus irregularis]
MSNINISPHLILTPIQKEQLRSIPISEFTDKKWESQNDAASFLNKHNLILKNKSERKWKVRYSNKAKGICLLQCCCGSDMSLRQKNGKTRIRKSRKIHKFVGCLAFARIKKFKNESIHISGYLSHSGDCQRQDPSYTLDGPFKNNVFAMFYFRFYKLILDKEFPNLLPHKKLAKAGEMWESLPTELKNSFNLYHKRERSLNEFKKIL